MALIAQLIYVDFQAEDPMFNRRRRSEVHFWLYQSHLRVANYYRTPTQIDVDCF